MIQQSNFTGQQGEELAKRYMHQRGYRIIAQNYHMRGGEIDLIGEKNGILVFAEVKLRRSHAFGGPQEALTNIKKQRLLRAIMHYIVTHKVSMPWRCDLIAISVCGNNATLHHLHNIFLV